MVGRVGVCAIFGLSAGHAAGCTAPTKPRRGTSGQPQPSTASPRAPAAAPDCRSRRCRGPRRWRQRSASEILWSGKWARKRGPTTQVLPALGYTRHACGQPATLMNATRRHDRSWRSSPRLVILEQVVSLRSHQQSSTACAEQSGAPSGFTALPQPAWRTACSSTCEAARTGRQTVDCGQPGADCRQQHSATYRYCLEHQPVSAAAADHRGPLMGCPTSRERLRCCQKGARQILVRTVRPAPALDAGHRWHRVRSEPRAPRSPNWAATTRRRHARTRRSRSMRPRPSSASVIVMTRKDSMAPRSDSPFDPGRRGAGADVS